MQKLSTVLITLNEISCIKACIESISFANEIIVVDSYSTDGTWEYLSAHPKVKAFQNPFKNYTDQKTYALSLATHDWVLLVDADEVITEQLQKEIMDELTNPEYDAYYIYRKFIMNGVPLKFCGYQTDKQLRLFNKHKAHFLPGKLVHERLITEGTSQRMKNPLDHHFYKSYEDYTRRILSYGQLKGMELYRKGAKNTLFLSLIKPSYKFIHMYLIRFGILDGKRGFIIASINAKGVAERYKKLKTLKKQEN